MPLSIRKASVETKARQVAALHGLTMTGAIERALDNEIAREAARFEVKYREVLREVREIQAAYAELPDSGLTEQDIMGWDENGLPT